MTASVDRFTFPVQQCGSAAANILGKDSSGKVAAVFNSSFYIETASGIACIGNEDIGRAPLNIASAAPGTMHWPASGLRINDSVKVSTGVIRVGSRFLFPIESAKIHVQTVTLIHLDAVNLECGLSLFRHQVQGNLPADGLAYLISGSHPSSLFRTAEAPISNLQRWLIRALSDPEIISPEPFESIKNLIGLGPGLTPSGDDFIGGMMIALHYLNEAKAARLFWGNICDYSARTNNPITHAHLQCAANGLSSEGIQQALIAIFKACPVSVLNSLPDIDRIGHTSGWDCMAGVVFTLDSWLCSRNKHSQKPTG